MLEQPLLRCIQRLCLGEKVAKAQIGSLGPNPQLSLDEDILQNTTAFAKILRGAVSARLLHEDREYLAFRNVKPYARLAGLVVPRRFVPQDPFNLSPGCLAMVQQMRHIAHDILRREEPLAYESGDFWLRFHLPPHCSVDHLHLHVVAPASEVTKWETRVIFNDRSRACDADALIDHLRKGAAILNEDNDATSSTCKA